VAYDYVGVQEYVTLRWMQAEDHMFQNHIVRLVTSFYVKEHFCIVMELLGVSLGAYRLKFELSIEAIRAVALQLVTALGVAQQSGIIHADLKPENILVTPSSLSQSSSSSSYSSGVQVKVIDFGNSLTMDDVARYFDTFEVQTRVFRAPEVLLGLPFGFPIDMWSLGGVLIELYTGRTLFEAKTNELLFEEMVHRLGPFPENVYCANGEHKRPAKFAKKYFTQPQHTSRGTPNDSLARLECIAQVCMEQCVCLCVHFSRHILF
jgi:serine/threonine protein kinase